MEDFFWVGLGHQADGVEAKSASYKFKTIYGKNAEKIQGGELEFPSCSLTSGYSKKKSSDVALATEIF